VYIDIQVCPGEMYDTAYYPPQSGVNPYRPNPLSRYPDGSATNFMASSNGGVMNGGPEAMNGAGVMNGGTTGMNGSGMMNGSGVMNGSGMMNGGTAGMNGLGMMNGGAGGMNQSGVGMNGVGPGSMGGGMHPGRSVMDGVPMPCRTSPYLSRHQMASPYPTGPQQQHYMRSKRAQCPVSGPPQVPLHYYNIFIVIKL